MEKIQNQNKQILYPPGGILIWIIVIVEMITFLMASLSFMAQRANNVALFNQSQEQLNLVIGTINTVILISSGYFMARSVTALEKNNHSKSTKFITLSTILGVLFLILKGIEYAHKIESGLTLNTNTFYSYYWLMTGFHFVHVLLGCFMLLFMRYYIKAQQYNSENLLDVKTVATYWHMCDLIWILIFPILYLIK